MTTKDFYFDLPQRLIAQTPLADRDASRLMVLDGDKIEQGAFRDLPELLNAGDCLVLNDTKVIPARLIGEKKTGAKIELLLLKRLDGDRWECLAKPGKRVRVGDEIVFGGILSAKILEVKDDGNRVAEFHYGSKYGVFEEILDRLGEMPLPPYITEKLAEPGRYQTVYAKHEGSAAAPTAGLHFTNELLERIRSKGVTVAYITLHVGLGTFRPVKVENINDHHMHSEFYNIERSQADLINSARANGGKIIAVGTTVTRTLESCADENGNISAQSGWTDIFIYPGYQFKIVDELITNSHLPESTLIMLVSALTSRERILRAYGEAVRNEYRFFSFGDAMFIR